VKGQTHMNHRSQRNRGKNSHSSNRGQAGEGWRYTSRRKLRSSRTQSSTVDISSKPDHLQDIGSLQVPNELSTRHSSAHRSHPASVAR
jgi:hypothetical protein